MASPGACATYLLLVSRDEGDGDPDRLVLKNDGLVVLTGTSVDLGETAVLDSGLNILRDDPGEVEISSLDDLGRVEDNIYTAGSDAGTDTLELWSPDLDVEGTAQIHVVDHLTGLTVSRENSTDALTSLTLEPGDQVQLTAQGYLLVPGCHAGRGSHLLDGGGQHRLHHRGRTVHR